MLGWLLLAALTALAAFAALGVAARLPLEGRAERALAALLVFYAVVAVPIFALGYTGLLRAPLLAVLSVATSSATFAVSARGSGLRAHAEATRELGRALARVPGDAFKEAIAARSFAVLGLAATVLAIVASAWLSWLAVSESWDGFFYHEPIVGFALQNKGFRMVDLPPAMVVQGINGYPKLCEGFALWFVIFTDKTLIEIGNTVAAPGLVLASYLLVRRFDRRNDGSPAPSADGDRPSAMGWATLVLLMPAMLTQLRTSMIDVEVQLFLAAAVLFATRPRLDATAAALAFLAMALLTGSKSSALVWVPPIALVATARLFFRSGTPLGRASAVAAVGILGVTAIGALTFVPNYLTFKNPVWPVTTRIGALGIDWPGIATLRQVTPEPPLWQMLKAKYQHPIGGIPDIIARDYGYGVPWVIAPLGLIAAAAAIFVAVRGRVRRTIDEPAERLLVAVALGAVLIKLSPSLNIGRYNAAIVAIGIAAIGWLSSRLRGRLGDGALGAATMLTLVPWIWTDWFFGVDLGFGDIKTLIVSPARERKSLDFAKFQMPSAVARAKEKDLANGGLVVFTQDSNFIGAFFDHRMQNRLVYVKDTGDDAFLDKVTELAPRWVVVGDRSPSRARLASDHAHFELVGPAVKQDNTSAFRTLGP
jgi:hypothetical protein